MSRSGTTFLGNLLTLDESRSIYLHEPVKLLLREKYRELPDNKELFWDYAFNEKLKCRKLHYLVFIVIREILAKRVKSGQVFCIKPIAMYDLVSEVRETLNCHVVYIVRHPCGYIESLVRQQGRKVDEPSKKLSNELFQAWGEEWSRQHNDLLTKMKNDDEWKFIKFEDLCVNTARIMNDLYSSFDLGWSEEINLKIKEMTSTNSDDYYGVQRMSQQEINKYADTLSDSDIEAIREGTLKHMTELYENF